MIEEPSYIELTWSHRPLGKAIWILLIISFLFGLVMQLGGLTLTYRDAGDSYLWWRGLAITGAISGIVYYLLTPMTLILFSAYLFLNRKNIGNIALVACFTALLSGVTWGAHFVLHRMAYDLQDVANAIVYWSLSMVLLGITFTLIGVLYLRCEQTNLTRLTALSFIVTGVNAVIVGYVGGFTLLPWFTIYDFPWVTTIALIPCLLALVLTIGNTQYELSRQ